MSDQLPLGVVFVGCGNISDAYAHSLETRPDLVTIIGSVDIVLGEVDR